MHIRYKLNKYTGRLLAAVAILTVVLGQGTMQTVLAGLPCPTSMTTIDCNAIHGPWVDWVPGGALCSSDGTSDTFDQPGGGTIANGASVYILGDSITVRSEQSYKSAFAAKQITPVMNGWVGRSWTSAGNTVANGGSGTAGASYESGSSVVNTDKAKIASASGIVIALGSNGGLSGNPIDSMINTIRGVNPKAPIWWVNVTGTTDWTSSNLKSYMGAFNKALQTDAATDNFQIINWANAVTPSGDPTKSPGGNDAQTDPQGLLADGLHPNSKGIPVLTNLVVNAVTGGTNASGSSTQSATCCATGSTGTTTIGSASLDAKLPTSIDQITHTSSTDTNDRVGNARIVYQYLVGKGLSPIQAAGIMGNIDWESDYRADNASERDWPKGGYGIAQWTAGRRLAIVSAMNAAGIGDYYQQAWSTGSKGLTPPDKAGILLGFQLDYLWWELNNGYSNVLTSVKNATTIEQVTTIFFNEYEGAGDWTLPKRIQRANWALRMFGASSAGAPGIPISSSCSGSGDTGSVGVGEGSLVPSALPAFPGADAMIARARQLAATPRNATFQEICGSSCHNLCDHIAASVWEKNGGHSGYCSAIVHWQSLLHYDPKDVHKATDPDGMAPPVGALLFYNAGNVGHVTVYLGNNMVLSNDVLGDGGAYITSFKSINNGIWHLQYLGWTPPLFGTTPTWQQPIPCQS